MITLNRWLIGETCMNHKFDSIKRTSVLLILALDHYGSRYPAI